MNSQELLARLDQTLKSGFNDSDLNLFNLVKSVAAVAKKGKVFPTKAYDPTTLELKYPQNIISVAPPTAKASPILPGETRVTSLSNAVYAALLRARLGGVNGRAGCSIVVHEGIYFGALEKIPHVEVPDDFTLEIVGVKDVVLIETGVYIVPFSWPNMVGFGCE